MRAFIIRKNAVSDWIKHLARKNSVSFPQRAGHSGFRFKPVLETSEIQFEHYRPTLAPPGKQLTPAREVLFKYRKNATADPMLESVLDSQARVLAGVRPCDLKAIDLMDRVNREGFSNPHYLTRRENTVIIAHDCLQPCDAACFCAATGSLHWRANADVFLTSLDDEILVECLSERGIALAQGDHFTLCENTEPHKKRAEALRTQPFGRQFPVPLEQLPAIIAKQWQSRVWEKHVEHCFSCGSCNMVCPTCYCFNVVDDFNLADGDSGTRTSTWDGCMLPNFSEVAGGHNFRPHPAARQRHRVKRKFEYLSQRFQEPGFCIGCGRCARQCTAQIDIFSIVSDLVSQGENDPCVP
ncbi:MAG: hypothetical protein HW380_3256 [Magnetococcales bacterium]|nr:hypothetical protein [Magnetococcales bacterium]